MDMKDYLSRIRQRILRDGADKTLQMIRAQKITGPSASDVFGEEFGLKLAESVMLNKMEACSDSNDSLPTTLLVYSISESGPESAEGYRAANDDYFELAVAA